MFKLVVKPALVWKRLGMPAAPEDAGARADFDDAYGRACAFLKPHYTTARRRIIDADGGGVTLEGRRRIPSADLARLAENAAALAFIAVTVGEGIDDLVEGYNRRGEAFRMTVADAVGSVAAEELMARVHADLKARAAAAGEILSRRISPGFGDFELSYQPLVLGICRGARLGIALTENFMMTPRKSVTAVAAVKPR